MEQFTLSTLALVLGCLVCVHGGEIEFTTGRDTINEDYKLNTYYPEGFNFSLLCRLKRVGTHVEWTWTSFEDNIEHPLTKEGRLLPPVAVQVKRRFQFTDQSTDDMFVKILRVRDAKPWESGSFACRTSGQQGEPESAVKSINIAGKIKDTSVKMITSADLDEEGHVNVTQGEAFAVTCVTNAANVVPVLTLGLGNRNLQEYMERPKVEPYKHEKIPSIGMYEVTNQVTVKAKAVSISCDDHGKTLTCSAAAPVRQKVTTGLKVKVVGCVSSPAGGTSVVGATALNVLLSVMLFINIL